MRLATFYTDVNREWLKTHRIPADNDSVSIFDILEERIRKQCIDIIRTEMKKDTKMGHYIQSIYSGRSNDLKFINNFLNQHLAECKTKSDIFRLIGLLRSYNLRTPIEIDIDTDMYNNKIYNVTMCEPVIGILKSDFDDKSSIYTRYKRFLEDFFAAAGMRGHTKFLEMESEIADVKRDTSEANPIELENNTMSFQLLSSRYPNIDWNSLMDGFGIPNSLRHKINYTISNPKFFELLNRWAKKDLEYWKFIMRAMAIVSLSAILPDPFRKLHYEFFLKFLQGITRPYDEDREAFVICDDTIQNQLGSRFVDSRKEEFARIKSEATKICRMVLTATKLRIRKLNWMSEGTKHIAIDKVDKMGLLIGYPEVWFDELKYVQIDKSMFLANLLMIRKQATMMSIKKLQHPVDKRIWDYGCYDVNAYYITNRNYMIIPLGFLQDPFFGVNFPFNKNLAGLGNIVGHEIAHGFDELGHKYDRDGNYRPWWTSVDNSLYKTKTKLLIDEYSKELYKGNHIDGEMTLGENLADFGAISINLDILNKHIDGLGLKGATRNKELRSFFIYYAESWASKERPEKAERDAKTDVHPPAELRVNVVLRHCNDFYEAFGFNEDDEGGVSAESRIDIWG